MRALPFIFCALILSFHADAQHKAINLADTSIYNLDTLVVKGKKYFTFFKEDDFYLVNARKQIVLKQHGEYRGQEFRDINKDGYKDILLDCSGNTGEVYDLILFDNVSGVFKKIKDFDNFPAPEKIKSTGYYYSYHKSGCADLNWDSDLFYIHNFKAIRVGNIHTVGCPDEKRAIRISKIKGSKKILVRAMALDTGDADKWEFIKKYWTANYPRFL